MNDKYNVYLFPAVLKNKLLNNELSFPNHTEYKYNKIWAYRCIERKKEDDTPINRTDFYSNIEEFKIKGKKINKKRGQQLPEDDIRCYATSLYTNRDTIEIMMYLPRPSKKICSGYVFMEGGPQATDDEHINWWIYEEIDLSQFSIEKGEKNE